MGRYGLTTFHLIDTDNVDSAFSPEVIRPCVPMHSEEHPTSAPFWVRPDSNFGLFCNNDVYQQFRFLSHIIFACSLTVSVANSLAASSRLPLLLVLRKGYCVPFRFLMGITDHFVNGRRRRRYGGSSHLEDNQSSDLRVTQRSCSRNGECAAAESSSHPPTSPLYLHVLSFSSIYF